MLGTQFDVTADSSQTKVTVNEGRVRVERLTDGRVVEVPAAHQTVASIEVQQEFVVTALEKPTNSWKANLANEAHEGRWISAMHALRLEVGRAVDNGEMTADEARQGSSPEPRICEKTREACMQHRCDRDGVPDVTFPIWRRFWFRESSLVRSSWRRATSFVCGEGFGHQRGSRSGSRRSTRTEHLADGI